MKKFLALAFVCAGLTAMAGMPQLNRAHVTHKAEGNLVMKGNSMAAKFMAPAMGKAQSTSFSQFVRENNVDLNANRLSKKAPMRVGTEELLLSKLLFMEVYNWSVNDNDSLIIESAVPSTVGGWNVNLTAGDEDGVYTCDGLYYIVPANFVVDLANKTVTMPTFTLASQTTGHGEQGRFTYDTVENVFYVNEKWFTEDAEPADLQGQILDDGSIIFNDGFLYYFQTIVTTSQNGEAVKTDTTAELSQIFRNPYMMVPTGNHSFDFTYQGNTQSDEVPVYMYQQNDTTVKVWNLWGFGGIGSEMIIYEDGTMKFPLQAIMERDVSEYASDLPEGAQMSNVFLNGNGGNAVDASDTYGLVNSNKITWDSTRLGNFVVYNNNYYFPYVAFPPMFNNVLTLNNDVFYYQKSVAPVISYVVNDENVVITAVGEGTVVLATSDSTAVENPYTVARGEADQTITMLAVAQQEGKLPSEIVSQEIVIPAKAVASLRGDVDNNGRVEIADVSALIDALLNTTMYLPEGADCDLDGDFGIGDVSALIDYLLNGEWTK